MTVALQQFYRIFWEDEVCRNIFLQHKELLLEKNSLDIRITDYYLQRIVLSNSLNQKGGNSEDKMIFRQENKFTHILNKIKDSKDKYLNEERIKNYFTQRYGETIHLAKKQAEEEGWLNFIFRLLEEINNPEEDNSFFRILTEYKVIPPEIDNSGKLEKYIESEFSNEARKF